MADKEEDEGKDAKKGGGMGKIMMLLPTLLLVGAAVWYFFLRAEPTTTVVLPTPTAGAVVKLDPITINLAGGHFLKLSMALQADLTAGDTATGSKALDLAISQFSGGSIEELSTEEGRNAAKEALIARIKFAYMPETEEGEHAVQEALKEGMAVDPVGSSPEGGAEGEGEGEAAAAEEGEAEPKAKSSEESGTKELEPSELADNQIIEASKTLTVLPLVYDVYFTEFVMQ